MNGARVATGPIASSSIAVIIPPWIVPMEFMKSGTAANSTLIAPLAGSRVRSFQPSSLEAGGRGLRPSIMSQNGPLRTFVFHGYLQCRRVAHRLDEPKFPIKGAS
jgi:hypothetical protein